MNNLNSLALFWPELLLSVTILVAIIADLFYDRKDSFKVAFWSLGGMFLAYIAIRLQNIEPTSLFIWGLSEVFIESAFAEVMPYSSASIITFNDQRTISSQTESP